MNRDDGSRKRRKKARRKERLIGYIRMAESRRGGKMCGQCSGAAEGWQRGQERERERE